MLQVIMKPIDIFIKQIELILSRREGSIIRKVLSHLFRHYLPYQPRNAQSALLLG